MEEIRRLKLKLRKLKRLQKRLEYWSLAHDCVALKKNWRQFWLLLWKNWLFQKKKIILTIILVLFPISSALLNVLLKYGVGHDVVLMSRKEIYLSFAVTPDLTDFGKGNEHKTHTIILAYAPKTDLVARIMSRAATLMGVNISPDLGFASETALEEYMKTNEQIYGAIIFVVSDDLHRLPTKITYKIRLLSKETYWKTGSTFSNRDKNLPPDSQSSRSRAFPEITIGYGFTRFLAIQRAVDLSLISEVNPSFDPTTKTLKIRLKQYPFPPHKEYRAIDLVRTVFPLIMMLSFVIIVPTICQEIVLEKENKFKELMKLMGMRMWLYWSSWFVKYMLFMLISAIAMTIVFHVKISRKGPVIVHTSATITFVFLLLYSLALITFCFLISTLFSKASYGTAAGVILFILSYAPFFYLEFIYDDMSVGQKFGASIDFNLAMGFFCYQIFQFETIGNDVHWSDVSSPGKSGDYFTMGHIMIMLLVDTVIHSLLTWYLDAVIPGEFGTRLPFHFPFTKEYWMGRIGNNIQLSKEDFMMLVPEYKRPYFETPMQNAKSGIQIRGLTKTFGSEANPAVNNLNIDIYEGNITALVGPNGAGKTTTMFMLTGFLSPSKGTAFINGLDITREMDEIRLNLGLCPQHNILYDELTVREHLLFFAVLKGSTIEIASLELNKMIKDLRMEEKIDARVKTLSGGQRRKLSIGIALIGGSKFVILDEPTSGMDPEARRQTWDILQSQRKNRTMILSTHYMDEADILGDRIAIMSYGEIQCYGTPMFLKNKYGVGYHLTIVKMSTCDLNQLRDVIKSQIPLTQMASHEAEEVTFVLPSQQASKFEKLFETLETDRETLGIKSFGVSVTTMEEVFLRVQDSSTLTGGPRLSTAAADAEIQGNASHADVIYQEEFGWKRQNLQLRAMFYKRLIHSMRNYPLILGQILIPTIFTILACFTLYKPTTENSVAPLTLDLTHFSSPITPYDLKENTPNAKKLATCYEASVSRHSRPIFINNEPDYSTMDAYLLRIARDHKDQYNWNYQIGATILTHTGGNLTIIGFFNSQAYHAIAISLSYLGNTLMQCFGNKEYQIETINHPFPGDYSRHYYGEGQELRFAFSVCLSFGLALLFATFVVFLVNERKSGAKHSQLVSGVKLRNFWLATFLWDYVNYLIPCIFIIVVIVSFKIDGYYENTGIIFIGLMLHGFSMLPFIYAISFRFQEASVGLLWITVICFVTGTVTTAVGILGAIAPRQFKSTWNVAEWILYILFPTYCFNAVLQNIYKNYNGHKVCSEISHGLKLADMCASEKRMYDSNPCCPDTCTRNCIEIADNYLSFTFPGIGRSLVFMVVQGVVFFHILQRIETNIDRRRLQMITSKRVSQAMAAEIAATGDGKISEDSDVANERQRIQSHPIQELVKTDTVVIQDLTKLYGDFVVVNQLCIGVSQKECFGLLGVNGAGKTTVFKMLTGEILPSSGSAYIAGISVQDDLAEVRQKIGYCAQFDSIIDQMTVHETLWMYACAHGIPDQFREKVIDRLMERLTLKPHTKKRAGNLSGGNKRKLCVAVALMGNPTVVFLDEPTTGVDPEARRHVWNTLADARHAGVTIILTSHSMEECESICTRVGILVNGRFLCLGSLQHLRDKFSDGYTLTIKLQRSSDTDKPQQQQELIEKVKTFISETFPESVLKDHHENLLHYQINTLSVKWSHIFGIMEKVKVKYQIEDYSVRQTTLEQIFIGLARLQQGPREISKRKCFGLC